MQNTAIKEVKPKKVIVMDSIMYICPECRCFCSEETNYEKVKESCPDCGVHLKQ